MARIFMSIRMIIERTVSKILRLAPFAKYIEFSIRSNNIYKRMFGKVKFLGDHFQDLFAYMYLEKKQNGFYIDIGANDGVTASNTCVFEQLGWRGVCVEPQPEIYRQLRKSRNCDCYNAAVSSKSDDCVEFVIAGDHGVNPCSGLADGFTASLRKNINEMRLKTKTIKVKTMTFDDVMKNYPDVTHIDYMSIDVEGAEADILETIDFEKYSFGFVTIEGNEPEKITALMEKRNYEKLVKIGLDIVFVPRRVGGGGVIWFISYRLFCPKKKVNYGKQGGVYVPVWGVAEDRVAGWRQGGATGRRRFAARRGNSAPLHKL